MVEAAEVAEVVARASMGRTRRRPRDRRGMPHGLTFPDLVRQPLRDLPSPTQRQVGRQYPSPLRFSGRRSVRQPSPVETHPTGRRLSQDRHLGLPNAPELTVPISATVPPCPEPATSPRPGIGNSSGATTLPAIDRPSIGGGNVNRPSIGNIAGGNRPTTLPGNLPGAGNRPNIGDRPATLPGNVRPGGGDRPGSWIGPRRCPAICGPAAASGRELEIVPQTTR